MLWVKPVSEAFMLWVKDNLNAYQSTFSFIIDNVGHIDNVGYVPKK